LAARRSPARHAGHSGRRLRARGDCGTRPTPARTGAPPRCIRTAPCWWHDDTWSRLLRPPPRCITWRRLAAPARRAACCIAASSAREAARR